jgi:hypothetical protein
MNKPYSKEFSELKPKLRYGSYAKIAESTKGITKQDVNNAFNGRISDSKKLFKILTAAQTFLVKEAWLEKQAKAGNQEVKAATKKVA